MQAEANDLMGVIYESESCWPANLVALDPTSCLATQAKVFGEWGFETGLPFHVYAGVECSPLAGDFEDKATLRLQLGENRAVEKHLWENLFRLGAVNITPVG